MADWQVEAIHKAHERDEFSCGKAMLDNFLKSHASQYEKRGVGRTYVALRPGEKRVVGYYTLAAGAIRFEHLPAEAARKLPRHPVPAILLGRLAVDHTAQGEGLGAYLLMDAVHRALGLAGAVGIHAVEVMAIDQDARAFYQKYGFVPLQDNELHLYLPMKSIEAGFAREKQPE